MVYLRCMGLRRSTSGKVTHGQMVSFWTFSSSSAGLASAYPGEELACLGDVVSATASGSKISLKKHAEGEEGLGMVSVLRPGKAYTHLAGAALLGERSASAQRRNDIQRLVMMARPRLKRAPACKRGRQVLRAPN